GSRRAVAGRDGGSPPARCSDSSAEIVRARSRAGVLPVGSCRPRSPRGERDAPARTWTSARRSEGSRPWGHNVRLTYKLTSGRIAGFWDLQPRRAEVMTAPTDVEHTGGLTRQDLLRRAAVGGGALIVGGNLAEAAGAAVGATPNAKRGGTFRIGVSGGSAKDFIDGQNIVTRPDQARIVTGWETLVVFDSQFKLKFDGLAEEIEPNKKADVWTIRVHDGIEFHN